VVPVDSCVLLTTCSVWGNKEGERQMQAYLTVPLTAPHHGHSLHRLHLSPRALKAAAFCVRSILGFCMRLQSFSLSCVSVIDLQGQPRVWQRFGLLLQALIPANPLPDVAKCNLVMQLDRATVTRNRHRAFGLVLGGDLSTKSVHSYLRYLRLSSASRRTCEQFLQMACRICRVGFIYPM